MSDYALRCSHPSCNELYPEDDCFRLFCDRELKGEHGPALLQCVYPEKRISVRAELPGVFKYIQWLPVGSFSLDPNMALGSPFCYQSKGLAQRLGLENLFIAFSGYWPEKEANLVTRTFKEFECQASIVRYLASNLEEQPLPFIVASAGNTGNGYNLLAHLLDIPLYLVIPETGLSKLLLPFKTKTFVIVVQGDYSDAIEAADRIAEKIPFARDGGVRNVARRAGMGTVMLHAVAHPEQGTQRMFDHYVQAVGSGSGAIAAWEAVELLCSDGRFGQTRTKIHMAQNHPFTPIPDSWEGGTRHLACLPEREARERIDAVTARVLTNRSPPYSMAGGAFDVLSASGGTTWKVNNYELFHAARMFRETEGVDIGPAAAVAVDALKQASLSGKVLPEESILLHITGGGKEIQYTRGGVHQAEVRVRIRPGEIHKAIDAIGEPMRISNQRDFLRRYEAQ